MTRNNDKRNAARVMRHMVMAALVVAFAAAPAMAGGVRVGLGSPAEPPKGTIYGTFVSTVVATVSTAGCAPTAQGLDGCRTAARFVSGPDFGFPCTQNVALIYSATQESGTCAVKSPAGGVGTASVKVSSSANCDHLIMWDLTDSNVALEDATGGRWTITHMALRGLEHQATPGTDTWRMQDGSGVLTSVGSQIQARNGSHTMIAFVNGSMASVGSCARNAAGSQYVVTATIHGWMIW